MLTDTTGQVQIDVPRDRAGSFTPQIVKKRQRRLTGVDEIALSLYAKGLTVYRTVDDGIEIVADGGRARVRLLTPERPFADEFVDFRVELKIRD